MVRPDVLVVGDGPAGCGAAIAAAAAGCDVTMMGRARARAVPECASQAALRLLDTLAPGLASQPRIWFDDEVHAQPGRAVDRAQFDIGLRAEALRAGIDYRQIPAATLRPRIEDGQVAGVAGGGHDMPARIVIDATGVNGWLRRSLGLAECIDSRPWWLQRGFAVIDAEQAGTHFDIAAHGWLWRRTTVRGCIWTALGDTRETAVAWPEGMRAVGPVWRECRRWRHLREPAGAGYFVCGDAAGYLDPASGDGLRFALESGARAGALAAGVVRWPQRGSLSAALYADWALQTYLAGRAALAGVYARANLAVL